MDWVSVDDRLPNKQGQYLVYIPGEFHDTITTARYAFNRKLPWRGVQAHSAIEDVTHWMELPEKPTD